MFTPFAGHQTSAKRNEFYYGVACSCWRAPALVFQVRIYNRGILWFRNRIWGKVKNLAKQRCNFSSGNVLVCKEQSSLSSFNSSQDSTTSQNASESFSSHTGTINCAQMTLLDAPKTGGGCTIPRCILRADSDSCFTSGLVSDSVFGGFEAACNRAIPCCCRFSCTKWHPDSSVHCQREPKATLFQLPCAMSYRGSCG